MEELLAVSLSPLVGRQGDLADLRAAIDRGRLVTITGPGGVGKTRLALAAAEQIGDGARCVALSGLVAEELLVPAVLTAIGGQPEADVDPMRTIAALLGAPGAVLFLDNCEHLQTCVADLVAELFALSTTLKVVATSRFAVGVPGELEFELAPLSLGPDGDAVQLFIDRAGRAGRGFASDAPSLGRIAQLCARLDGLPLAIELAAARTRMLSVERIAEDLGRCLDMLSGDTALGPRQRSLRSSIQWSYELLSDRERELVERLSVFAGGWELDAAQDVCAASGMSSVEVLDGLAGLVTKSLIVVDHSGPSPRFGMLTTIRAFAHERLAEREWCHAAGHSHATWCASLVEASETMLTGAGQVEALAVLDRETENIRAALDWCTSAAPELGARIAAASALYWLTRGRFAEGHRELGKFVPTARSAGGHLRVRTLWGDGLMLVYGGELEAARPIVEEAVDRARDLRDQVLVARSLNLLGELVLMIDPPRAITALDEAVSLARETGDDWCLAESLGMLGAVALYRSDALAARDPFEESLALARSRGDERAIHRALAGLARTTAIEGRPDEAIGLLSEALEISGRLGDRSWQALDLAMLGELHRGAGRPLDGRAHTERGLALADEIESRYASYVAIGVLGRIALTLGQLDEAERYLTDAHVRAARFGLRPFASWWSLGLGDIAIDRDDVTGAADHARAALAAAERAGNRRDAARATTLLALVASHRSNHELAISELRSALAIQREVDDTPGIRRSLSAMVTALRATGRTERAERIEAVAAAGRLAEATAMALRGAGPRNREPAAGWGGLTRAEAEVAELAATGASNPEIGERLFMSRSTVKTHLSRVFAKLELSNRTELSAALAELRRGD